MAVTVGEEEKEPLHFHAGANLKQRLQAARTQVAHPFHQGIDLMKALVLGQFV